MNWEAIGAIGEIAGAVAVVLSLAYLAIQVRHNTQMMRRSSSSDAVAAFREFTGRLIDDPEANRIFRDGLEGLDNLSEDDRPRCWTIFYIFFKTFEDLHYQFQLGFLDVDVWRSYEFFAKGYITSPGAQEYWKERREAFTPAFGQWCDSLAPNANFRRLGRLADEDTESERPRSITSAS